MRVLLDTNVILDLVLRREDFYKEAVELFGLIELKQIKGYICATSMPTLHYVLRKSNSNEECLRIIDDLLRLFEITNVDKKILFEAIEECGKDYEDSVIYTSAKEAKMDFIVTRDKNGFANSVIKVLSPKEFLSIV